MNPQFVRDLVRRDRLDALIEAAVNNYSPPFAEEPATRVFARFLEDAGVSYQRQPVAVGEEEYGDGAAAHAACCRVG